MVIFSLLRNLEWYFFPIGGFLNLVSLHLNYLFWVYHSVCKMDALWKQKGYDEKSHEPL